MSTWIAALRETIRPRGLLASATARRLTAMGILVLATIVSASVVIPIPGSPVPVTLQTFVVLAGAGLLGARRGAWAQSAYLLIGGLGLPFFAGAGYSGLWLLGVTGGYLIGFVLASALIGRLLASLETAGTVRILAALVAGELVILACGVLWLAAGLHVSLVKAAWLGAVPFLAGDAVKLAAAAGVIRAWGARARRFTA